jgi:hypothetical protein
VIFSGEVLVMMIRILSLISARHWHGLVVERRGCNHVGNCCFFGGSMCDINFLFFIFLERGVGGSV